MYALTVSTAWVAVVGTAVGGLISLITSWGVHQWERAARISERSHAERKDAYAALLTHSENSLHLFQWLAEGQFSPAGIDEDTARANTFYDQEVTPRYMVLKIMGQPEVVAAARELRRSLNGIRHLMVDTERPPTAESAEFKTAHGHYRAARDRFTEIARADLEQR